MTDRLEHIEALLAAATPGPWEVHQETAEECPLGEGLYVDHRGGRPVAFASSGNNDDAALIVAARNALPDLVAAVKAARGAEDSLSYLPDYPHQPDCGAWDVFCATCYGLIVRDELRAALAKLAAES